MSHGTKMYFRWHENAQHEKGGKWNVEEQKCGRIWFLSISVKLVIIDML